MADMRLAHLALVASLASLAAACGSTVTSGTEGCPESLPSYGSACDDVGLECTFQDLGDCGSGQTSATCTDDGWQTAAPRCSPPIEECPLDQPEEGSFCGEPNMRCEYELVGSCGTEWVVATCGGEGWWEVEYVSEFCSIACPMELPIDGSDCNEWGPVEGCGVLDAWACGDVQMNVSCVDGLWQVEAIDPCETSCDALGNAASCGANPACQWLVPGCGDVPLAAEGCFPVAACDDEACPEDTSCQTVVADPCWNSLCDACGMEVTVCQPDMNGG